MTIIESTAAICRLLGRDALPGASMDAIAAFEDRYQLILSSEVRSFLSYMNGSSTCVLDSLMTFAPLEKWQHPSIDYGNIYKELSNYFNFADHMLDSWAYAMDLSDRQRTPVYVIDGVHPPKEIAPSLSAFLDAVCRDAPSLYDFGKQ